MFRFTKYFVASVLWLALFSPELQAFSLRGPAATWQDARLGYNINNLLVNGAVKNLNEEYRWNVPTIYYACTPDFLTYFGDKGSQEIDKAFAILNALPSADEINVDDYPLKALRINPRAQALGLYDLKTVALTVTLQNIGLADPTRWVFTLRSRFIIGTAPTNYYVIKRNFDPVTWNYSSFINGQLWTYNTIIDDATGAGESLVPAVTVDPLALGGLLNAPVAADNFLFTSLIGGFWTGLTRDDVGGLKYIYRSLNQNVETMTNAVGVGFGGGGGSTGSPWTVPGPVQPGTGIPGTSSNFVGTALRPGVGKLNFQRVFYESQLGSYPSNNVTWTDRYITNGSTLQQTLLRPQIIPDILFDGADLQGPDSQQAFILYSETGTSVWENNDALNGIAAQAGPGVIPPSTATITFNTVGPTIFNIYPLPSGFLSEANNAGRLFVYGTFDGSTNAPIIYPNGTTIQEIEQKVLGGGGGGGTGTGGTGLSPWTVPLPLPPTTTTGGGGATTTP